MKCGCTDHSFQSDHYKQKETGNSHNFSSRVYSWCQIDLLELRTESFWWCESKLIARLSSLNRDTWRGLHTLHCSKRQGYTKIKTRTGTGSTMYTRLYKSRDKYEDRDKWNVCLVEVKLFLKRVKRKDEVCLERFREMLACQVLEFWWFLILIALLNPNPFWPIAPKGGM